MSDNLDRLDAHELRFALDKHIGGSGQFDRRVPNQVSLHLPVAGEKCKIILVYKDGKIVSAEPSPYCNADEWAELKKNVEKTVSEGPDGIGREIGFSSFRVNGSWRGEKSGIQLLPPPEDAPQVDFEMAAHPFILEFPIKTSDYWPLTNHRRLRNHRQLTLLLNVLLNGNISCQPKRTEQLWAVATNSQGEFETKWVQRSYFAKIGKAVAEGLSPPASTNLEKIEPEEYYAVHGHDGKGLRVPTDLDAAIMQFFSLSPAVLAKFERSMFWMDLASRQWEASVSASFASLVSAVEALTERGQAHSINCPECKLPMTHEVPGATQRFRDFFEVYAPGTINAKRRNEMYAARSGILHGSELFQIDMDRHFGWDPIGWNQHSLTDQLWKLTRLAMRNWLAKTTK